MGFLKLERIIMKTTNEKFKSLLLESNIEKETIDLIEHVLEDVAENKMTKREIATRNINFLIEKEVMRRDS